MINVRQGVFHLRNEEASYLFRVKDGFLEHLHFGARAETSDAPAFAARPGCGWGDSTLYREGSNADCLDILPLEWSGCGRGDYRESPLELSIGGRAVSTDFRYLGCEVLKEPPPSALPVSRGQTILAVYLEDAAAKLRLTLLYGVLPTVFTRRAILENCGSSAVHIRKCMSACTELPGDWELHTFSGGWIAEMQHTRTPVTMARTCLESTTGASSSRANPGFLLAAPDAGGRARSTASTCSTPAATISARRRACRASPACCRASRPRISTGNLRPARALRRRRPSWRIPARASAACPPASTGM